jgi:hypothetical protein
VWNFGTMCPTGEDSEPCVRMVFPPAVTLTVDGFPRMEAAAVPPEATQLGLLHPVHKQGDGRPGKCPQPERQQHWN